MLRYGVIFIFVLVLIGCSGVRLHQENNTFENGNKETYDNAITFISNSSNEKIPQESTCTTLLTITWQEAYAALLRDYAGTPFDKLDLDIYLGWEWHFILHDIDRDNSPEMFVIMRNYSGHVVFHAIYGFSDYAVFSLGHSGALLGESIAVPPKNAPWIIMSYAVGSGGWLGRFELEENRLINTAEGFFILSEAGFMKEIEEGICFDWRNYKWYDLFVNGNPVNTEEFEYVFGNWHDKEWLSSSEITESNIQEIIFCWQPAADRGINGYPQNSYYPVRIK